MIYLVGGARPNFMKIAAISRAFDKLNIEYEIIHTGQHYDYNMDTIFFEQFNLKSPYINLKVGSGNHGAQTGRTMARFEKLCLKERPDMVFVVGDINSTMAAALVAAKLHIPISHQEAGMRSFDRRMPEEINRIVTDSISDYLFPISHQDRLNLYNEGIRKEKIFLVGDVMIDNLLYYSKEIEQPSNGERHILVEIHRPANTDNKENLSEIIKSLCKLSEKFHVVFPIHPRTSKMINKFYLRKYMKPIDCCKPMGYFDFMKYVKTSLAVITDSDGLQQETSILNIPCISIRDSVNAAYTIHYGTNVLVEPNMKKIKSTVLKQIKKRPMKSNFPDFLEKLNDGKAADRIAEIINDKRRQL